MNVIENGDPEMNALLNEIYDAELTRFDQQANTLVFHAAGTAHCVSTPRAPYCSLGTVGRLRLPAERSDYRFFAYPDQRLRRVPAEDDPHQNLWGWRIEQLHFAVRAGVITGKDGMVVIQDTESAVLELPREFLDLCHAARLRPETVLQGFIADLCALMNWVNCPREDGYSSNGSDERRIAQEYFRRAYGWLATSSPTS
jgi:hypothetical protein